MWVIDTFYISEKARDNNINNNGLHNSHAYSDKAISVKIIRK